MPLCFYGIIYDMKRAIRTLFVVIFTLVVFIFSDTASATDYALTIDSANLNQNQSIIFEEFNIGPGFDKDYNIHVENQWSTPVLFGIQEFQEDTTNTLTLNELNLLFKRNDTILLDFRNAVAGAGFTCIGPETNNLFKLNLSFDPSFGNEYQNKSFLIKITFRADAAECEHEEKDIDPPPPDQPPIVPPLPLLPNTGEDRGLYYFLLGGTILFAITTIILLIIFLVAKKRDRKDKKS